MKLREFQINIFEENVYDIDAVDFILWKHEWIKYLIQ